MHGHGPNQQNPEDMRNLIIFVLLSLVLWLGYDHFVMKPKEEALKAVQAQNAKISMSEGFGGTMSVGAKKKFERAQALSIEQVERIGVANSELSGSISTKGGRLDDLLLKNYYKTLEHKVPVDLLSPVNSFHPHYTEMGWISADSKIIAPSKNTQWQLASENKILTPDTPVTLRWDNGQGVSFIKEFSIDDKFMISVKQSIQNNTGNELRFFPYGLVSRHGIPKREKSQAGGVYEGPLGYINKDLHEFSFSKLAKKGGQEFSGAQGWIGMSQKYWLVAMIPDQNNLHSFRFTSKGGALDLEKAVTQVDVRGEAIAISSGQAATYTMHVFAGAKVVKDLEFYSKDMGISHLNLAVDFGMLYFITKPLYWLMTFFYGLVGNMGLAIIMITIVVRIVVFPLANTSYRSFAGLRKIAPRMTEIREKYGDDKVKLQEELVKLYSKEKVNPMAGCLPIIIQMPIFFAIFRVISMAIETRQAPFVGWIEDLSIKDPTSIINLFGVLPYDVPEFIPGFLNIGLWSIAMLFFMIMQQRLSPPPQDPTQKTMFAIMPFFFVFLLASFPSGLVIYFTFSNALGVLQQYTIMRMMGVEVHLFKRSKAEKEMSDAIDNGPKIHPELEIIEHEVEEALFGEDDDGDIAKAEAEKPAPKKAPKKAAAKTKKPAAKKTVAKKPAAKKTTTSKKDDKKKD
jgi:YidC/Oxa1 family membrane protein insertase|tara:strand:+ start:125622 stop:127670 length:2049 start_codon:yes stop_codon:yes gene_type:complete